MIKPFKTTEMRWVLLHYLIPLFVLMTFFSLLGIRLINNLYLFVAYIWPLCFLTEYSKDKVEISKYRYSTLKLLHFIDQTSKNLGAKIFKGKYLFLQRGVAPTLFVLILWIVFYSGYPWFAFLGYGAFELTHYLFRKKFQWNPLHDTPIENLADKPE